MNPRITVIGLAGVLLAACAAPAAEQPAAGPPPAVAAAPPAPPAAPPPPVASPPPQGRRSVVVARVRCESLLSAAPDDRAAASMFYLGYEAAAAHVGVVDINKVEAIERRALHYCLQHPHAFATVAYRLALVGAKRKGHMQ
jgi:hypothetical protein